MQHGLIKQFWYKLPHSRRPEKGTVCEAHMDRWVGGFAAANGRRRQSTAWGKARAVSRRWRLVVDTLTKQCNECNTRRVHNTKAYCARLAKRTKLPAPDPSPAEVALWATEDIEDQDTILTIPLADTR